MTNAWTLYDGLLAPIPPGICVRDACLGTHWSYVEAECGMGVAATCRGGRRERLSGVRGQSLAEVGALVRSWDLEVATLGVAAINAWYNREDLVRDASGRVGGPTGGDPFRELPGELSAFEREHGRRAQLVVVGRFPHMEGLEAAADVLVLEREWRDRRDLPDTACEYVLPEADFALITGMAETNRTMPRLLELARGARVTVVGPSATLSSALLDAGASAVAGSVVADPEAVRAAIAVGGSPLAAGGLVPALLARQGPNP